MMSTPLMIGCDLTKISDSTLSILKNRDLIALNQDRACVQAFVIDDMTDKNGNKRGEVWIKDLGKKNSPEKAIAFLNRSGEPLDFMFDISKAGLLGEVKHVRDLCKNEDMTPDNILAGSLKPHGIAVYKVAARESAPVINRDDTGEIVRKPIRKISLDEAMELVKQGAVLADVRTEREYAEWHLENAMNLSYLGIHAMAPRLIPDKKRTIIVYCATGKRSEQAKNSLEYMGYENVLYLGGVDRSGL